MEELRVAFWNVNNLYNYEICQKGPPSRELLDLKIAAIAQTLNDLFEGQGADLIGLAEIHTEDILNQIKSKMNGEYVSIFAPCRSPDWTGLCVLARQKRVGRISEQKTYRPAYFMMPRWCIVNCELQPGEGDILFVVNHWPSRLSPTSEEGRAEAGRELNQWLHENASN